jgi:hypothetical protein
MRFLLVGERGVGWRVIGWGGIWCEDVGWPKKFYSRRLTTTAKYTVNLTGFLKMFDCPIWLRASFLLGRRKSYRLLSLQSFVVFSPFYAVCMREGKIHKFSVLCLPSHRGGFTPERFFIIINHKR